MVIDVIDV